MAELYLDPHGTLEHTRRTLERAGYDHRSASARRVHAALSAGQLAVHAKGLRVMSGVLVLRTSGTDQLGIELWWDARGRMRCRQHVPERTGRRTLWRPMPVRMQRAWVELGGAPPCCAICHAQAPARLRAQG